MKEKTISILESFSEYPGLRHCSISDESGEEFYHKVLNSEFKIVIDNQLLLVVNLDGTAGYAPSFLDEAFGNLVFDFSLDKVKSHIKIVSTQEPSWVDLIENQTYVEWEERRLSGSIPKITADHDPWFRLSNGNLILKKWQ